MFCVWEGGFFWEKNIWFLHFPWKRNPPLWAYTQLTILICLRLLCQHWYAHVRTGGHYFWPIDLCCGSPSQSSCLSCQKHYVQLIEVENENGDDMSWPCYVILGVSLQTDDGEDDLKKGTQLLEIYALEIQMYTAQKNNKKLKALYEQSLHIKSAIPHPLIMGVIRGELVHVFPLGMLRLRGLAWRFSCFSPPECGGKMHLREGEFEKAHTDFFEAFKNYDESGSPRRTTCLKYLVLANMLMKSGINPFDSQEVCNKCLYESLALNTYVVFVKSEWLEISWGLVVLADTWSFDSVYNMWQNLARCLDVCVSEYFLFGFCFFVSFIFLKAKPYKNDPEILAMTNLVR